VGKIGDIAWSIVLKFLQEALWGGRYGEASTASSKNLPTSWNQAGQVIRNMGKSRQALDITLSWSKAESEAGYHVAVLQNARFTCAWVWPRFNGLYSATRNGSVFPPAFHS
jgi:hypothetical protein